MATARDVDVQLVGREAELAALGDFLAADHAKRVLVLIGEPGIGKTALWEAGVAAAGEHGLRVLSARASEPELQLSFVGLSDLLEGVDWDVLDDIPAPQLRALEVALLRTEPGDALPEPFAVSAGFTSALRVLAGTQPLLVAVDDVPWLDASSGDALAFAARRLGGHRVRFLLTRRPGELSELERASRPLELERLDVGPLSLGATRSLIWERLGVSLPRRVLRRLFETAQGNPLFALELGRTLAERGIPEIGADLPLPDAVEELFGSRVEGLSNPSGRLLLAVALSADLRLAELARIADDAAVADAVEAELLTVDGERVRARHPLLAEAAKRRSLERERRALHLELAEAVDDETLRALHLALATMAPDEGVAGAVAAAAATARARGAVENATELAEHALRLTPPFASERADRVLALAECLVSAAEHARATELLTGRLAELPPGRARARAHLLLGWSADLPSHHLHLEHTLAESEDEPALRAIALATRAFLFAIDRLERLVEAEGWAKEALELGREAGVDVEERALHALASVRILRGQPVDDLRRPFPAASDGHPYIYRLVDRAVAQQLGFRGEVAQARATFEQLLALVEERGDVPSACTLSLQLCGVELRAGDTQAAARRLVDVDWLLEAPSVSATYRAVLEPAFAALRGLPDEAERLAVELLDERRSSALGWEGLHLLRARGIAALLAADPRRAAESLQAVWEHNRREGVEDPGTFPVAPDLVEALVELGEAEQALAVVERLERLSKEQEHPWGLASVKRCRALIRLSAGSYDEEAAALLDEAAADYDAIGLRFDQARSLLLHGRLSRRHRKRAQARRSLEQAALLFMELGSAGWAEQARAELERIGGRRPGPAGALTATEERVARLAAEGLSNKEIAARLFVSIYTIEKHLSHAYEKLGVRSRGQLAQRLTAST